MSEADKLVKFANDAADVTRRIEAVNRRLQLTFMPNSIDGWEFALVAFRIDSPLSVTVSRDKSEEKYRWFPAALRAAARELEQTEPSSVLPADGGPMELRP